MATEVKLPELAEGVEKGEVTDVFVNEGDELELDAPLIEVNAEKATLTVPSTVKGRVAKLLVKKGDKVAVGEPILTIEEAGSSAPAPAEEKKPEAKPAKAPEGTKAVAEPVGKTSEEEEGEGGYEGAKQRVELTEEPEPETAKQRPAPAQYTSEELIPAGPAVRRIARELGVDLMRVQGSGRNGRILVEDLDPYIKGYIARRGGVAPAAAPGFAPIELPDFSKFGPIRRERADAMRRKIAERMAQSWNSVPHVHQFADADVTELLSLMKRQKERVKQAGGSLTFTVFAMKAVVLALKEFPKFNATWDVQNGEVIYKDYFNIGVAVDTPGGLLVPVVRDVDKKTLLELSVELPQLAQRTRDKKTTIDDLRGGSFTISNLGGIGGSHFTPIVNVPEVAILGIGRTERKPVFDKNGQVVARDICPLVLGYDHRVIDGADGARFISRLVEILENFEAAFLGF